MSNKYYPKCADCLFGVYNEEEPRAEWEKYDLDDGYYGLCYRYPPSPEHVEDHPKVRFNDFCGEFKMRI